MHLISKKNKTKKNEDDLLRDIVKQIEPLKRFLNLNEWEGIYKFSDLESTACITISEDYLTFNMELDREYVICCLEEKDFNGLTGVILHELCHIIIDPVYFLAIHKHGGITCDHVTFPFVRQRRENAVERVSRIAQQTLPASLAINLDINNYNL